MMRPPPTDLLCIRALLAMDEIRMVLFAAMGSGKF